MPTGKAFPHTRRPARQALLVTGFLAFGDVVENPSALLAERCGARHALLEVAYDAVDAFLNGLCDAPPPQVLLMLGVARRAGEIRLERTARNKVGPLPDVRGQARPPGEIEPGAPAEIAGTLFNPHFAASGMSFSDDAGDYLCNYIYYRALRRLPQSTRVGFVHVPPLEAVPLDIQHRTLTGLLDALRQS